MYDHIYDSPYEQYEKHVGKKCRILGEVSKNTYDADEIGSALFIIEFEDGFRIKALPEELFKDGVCLDTTIVWGGKVMRGQPYHPELFEEEL